MNTEDSLFLTSLPSGWAFDQTERLGRRWTSWQTDSSGGHLVSGPAPVCDPRSVAARGELGCGGDLAAVAGVRGGAVETDGEVGLTDRWV